SCCCLLGCVAGVGLEWGVSPAGVSLAAPADGEVAVGAGVGDTHEAAGDELVGVLGEQVARVAAERGPRGRLSAGAPGAPGALGRVLLVLGEGVHDVSSG